MKIARVKSKYEKYYEIFQCLNQVYDDLENQFYLDYDGTDHDSILEYMMKDKVENVLNYIKNLEYHYRDHCSNGHYKSKYPKELKRAHKLLAKYSQLKDENNVYSVLVLKDEFIK